VPLGISFHNEAKISEICKILDTLDQYVPAERAIKIMRDEDGEFEVDDTKVYNYCKKIYIVYLCIQVYKLFLFGDQLTVVIICSATVIRSTTDHGLLEKFEGFTPAIADWHARACF